MAVVTSMQIEKSFSRAHQLSSLSPTFNLFHADWSNLTTAQVLNPHFPVPNALIQCIDRFLILRLCLGSARNNPPRFVIGAFMDAMVKFLPEIRIILLICCQSLDILPWDNNFSAHYLNFWYFEIVFKPIQSNVQQVISTTSPRQAAFAQVFFPQQ